MMLRFVVLLTLMTSLLQPAPAVAQDAPEGAPGTPCEHMGNDESHCPGGADCECAQTCGGLVTDAGVFNPPRPPADASPAPRPTGLLSAFEQPPFRPPIA